MAKGAFAPFDDADNDERCDGEEEVEADQPRGFK